MYIPKIQKQKMNQQMIKMYIISLLITENIQSVPFLQLFVRCDDKLNSLDAGWNIPNDRKKNFN